MKYKPIRYVIYTWRRLVVDSRERREDRTSADVHALAVVDMVAHVLAVAGIVTTVDMLDARTDPS